MTLKNLYNQIAENYAIADQFGSISKSHECALQQIKKLPLNDQDQINICDLGVGVGSFLSKIAKVHPNAKLTGLDYSEQMLEIAQKKVDFEPIEANVAEANLHIAHDSQDLVLAHFINAYIPIDQLFSQTHEILNQNGYFSLITTTYDSFPVAQQQLANFISSDHLLARLVGHYYKSISQNTSVAANLAQLNQSFAEHDFKILEHQRLNLDIQLNTVDDLVKFGIEGTWFLNTLSIRIIPKRFLINRLKRIFSKLFTFPYHDTHVIDVVLAKV
jgi:ubiquinone/menaquinone biosynthesis C-methylase UbiE